MERRFELPKEAWTKIDVRDGEKGHLVMEIAKCPVEARTDGQRVGPQELLVVIRETDEHGNVKHDDYLSNAPPDTPREEQARVAKAAHRLKECLTRGKSGAGLSDYEVRSWPGWYHHQALSLREAWFLMTETRRGKKYTPAITVPQVRERIAL